MNRPLLQRLQELRNEFRQGQRRPNPESIAKRLHDAPASVWCHERGAMSRAVKGMGVALLTLVLVALSTWGVLAIYSLEHA
jgi:hypothetical protein